MAKELIRLKDCVMSYDDTVVLDHINLYINDKEFLTLLGPSGCGKTTTLRIIGGFLTPTSGDVLFDGVRINDVPPHLRTVNTVFQKYALFPHLNVFENVAFGLRIPRTEEVEAGGKKRQRKVKLTEDEITERVMEMLEAVNLKGFEKRSVSQLSGGQQQRVAIARALVNRPKVLLLDEPLGALDLKLRKDMQIELKRIQQAMGITFIYVTHDQEEALSMSDTVVVMDGGRIQQIGTPEDIDIVPVEQGQLVGTVTSVTFKGMQYDIIVDFKGFKWLIQTTDHSPEGARIGIKIDPDGIHIMKKSEYSGMFGDYSSFSEEYDELDDASLDPDGEEESEDEE